MFTLNNNVYTSSVLRLDGVHHAFSTRLGGVSTLPHTREMNVAPDHGDPDGTVRENLGILAAAVGCTADDTVCTHQIHSNLLRYVTASARGEGTDRSPERECDGFYTDTPGVALTVRTADCAPVLLAGLRNDGTPAVCAVHAGWRGSASGICALACAAMVSMGVSASSIRAAIGPCIHFDSFGVGEDMRDSVRLTAGEDFARRHIREKDGKLHADICAMNREFLLISGVAEENIDISPLCTYSNPDIFHSHRRTGNMRGAMGNMIAICR